MISAGQAKRRVQQMWLRVTTGALVCSLLALIIGTVLFAQQSELTRQQSARQVDLNTRLRQLQTMLVTLGDAETGQRGYLLTGKDRYLAPHRSAVARVSELLKSLDNIPLARASLAGHVAKAREFIALKFAELAQTIQLYDQGRRDEALRIVQTDVGQGYAEQARLHVNAVLDLIRAERDALNLAVAAGSVRSRHLAILVVSTLMAFVLLAAAQIVLLSNSRARSEQALAESETRHRTIVEDQVELISLARGDGVLTYVNRAYARHFGRSPDEMIGKSLYDFVEAADRASVREQVRSVIGTGQARHGENRMVASDGQERWVAWTNQRQTGADGEMLLHSVGRDVTLRKQAEEALRSSEDFLTRSGRVAGVGGWEFDLVTNAVRWSDQVRHIHEVPLDFVPTVDSAVAFYVPESREAIREALQQGMESGQPWDLELALVTAKGRRIAVRTVGEAEFDAGGKPVRLVGAFQDITERKTLELQLADSARFVREITDSLPVRIAYIDPDGRFLFANLAHCKRFNCSRDDIIGRTRRELTDGQTDAHVAPYIDAVLRGEPQRFEFEEMVNGEPRQIESQLIPHIGQDGVVQGFFSTGVDVTERNATERALRELIAIFDHTPDFVVQTDWQGNVQYLNPSVRRVLGFTPDQPVAGHTFAEFNTPETQQRYISEIGPAVRRDGVWLGETTVYVAGQRVVPVSHMVISHPDASGRTARYSAIMRDISEETKARNQLRVQTATLQAAIESIPAMVAVFGADMRYRLVNSAFERWKGLPRDQVVGRTALEVLGADDYERSLPMAMRALAGETVSYEKEYPESTQSRYVSLSYIPLRLPDGSIDGFIGVAQDITPHREQEIRLLYLSERDALTGLLNRAGFENFLTRKAHGGGAASMALLYIDLDHFKPVNDAHGHPVGDELLRLFSERLQRLVRPTDAVARLGGDEFAIVLSGVRERANADMVADKVVEAAHTPFHIGELTLTIGASVGVAFDANDGEGWKGLVGRADTKLYEAKGAGRGRRA
ncbi:MAG: PAS domain-containing protein [Rhizobacter sp.]